MTPVKNEAWILERFLSCASLWADRIILADQGSTDGSRDIASRFPRVTVVDNRSTRYDEGARQALLLDAARRVPGRRLIVALDADEVLSANHISSGEWEAVRFAPDGTVFEFDWIQLMPGLRRCWTTGEPVRFAFMDDGTRHQGATIHSTRIPVPLGAPVVRLTTVKVLHYQYTNWSRMRSKQRWYQCWEATRSPDKRPIQLYRQYHFMDAIPVSHVQPLDPECLRAYEERGIDVKTVPEDGGWWDEEVLDWIVEHGAERFRRLDIWDVDWSAVARRAGRTVPEHALRDPRTRFERLVHRWLRRTQAVAGRRTTRWLQRLLIPLGW